MQVSIILKMKRVALKNVLVPKVQKSVSYPKTKVHVKVFTMNGFSTWRRLHAPHLYTVVVWEMEIDF